MALNNAQLHPATIFNNQGFHNAATYSRYLRMFRDRPIYPSFSIHPSGLSKYDMNIPSLLDGLGWSSLVENMHFSHCPEVVRLFYVNLKYGPGYDLSFFTAYVLNYEITVTPTLLAAMLNCPHSRLKAHTYGVLPRDLSNTDILHSSDLWIISSAKASRSITYASLMFHHMIKFGLEYFSGPLPFGPQITKLLYRLDIDLRDKVIVCNVLDDLCPQHVLAKLDALFGARKLVTGSGGVMISLKSYQSERLVDALVDAAMAVNDPMTSDSEFDNEDGISEHESPLEYQF
ncbi:unnamed protein product [Linum trigynum]|uniref:Uncharacterized protein n=1 Tax=Linum trigynum TaxID=586398 RepID=A0AAV2E4U0_9ROSI